LSSLETEESTSEMHTKHQPANVAQCPCTVAEDAEGDEETGGGEDGETLTEGGRSGNGDELKTKRRTRKSTNSLTICVYIRQHLRGREER
jgi:hypothetical protein